MQWCIDMGIDFTTTNEPELLQSLLPASHPVATIKPQGDAKRLCHKQGVTARHSYLIRQKSRFFDRLVIAISE